MAELGFAKKTIKNAARVIFITGAGMSVDSNIRSFRGSGGFWNSSFLILLFFGTSFGWRWFPSLCWNYFYDHFYEPIKVANPHEGYLLLSEFQKQKPTTILTMNVDGLHKKAGNENVIELHGNVHRPLCNSVRKRCYRSPLAKTMAKKLRCPSCGGTPRPDVVLFQEELPDEEWIMVQDLISDLTQEDVVIIIGTSGTVSPTRELLEHIVENTFASSIEINTQKTEISDSATLFLQGNAKNILRKLFL